MPFQIFGTFSKFCWSKFYILGYMCIYGHCVVLLKIIQDTVCDQQWCWSSICMYSTIVAAIKIFTASHFNYLYKISTPFIHLCAGFYEMRYICMVFKGKCSQFISKLLVLSGLSGSPKSCWVIIEDPDSFDILTFGNWTEQHVETTSYY